jgi:hypothetical protein
MRQLLAIAVLGTALGFAGQAEAVPCTAMVASSVTGTASCETGTINNDKLMPLQVNIDTLFGFDDWVFAQKDNDLDGTDETSIDIGLSLLGDAISGTWGINDIWSMYSDVMLVFKGGNGNTTPNTYVGYLLNSGATGGTYISPFVNPNNQNLKNISHVSVYVRDMGITIPEPGSIALLGIGLAGLGLTRRRKKA